MLEPELKRPHDAPSGPAYDPKAPHHHIVTLHRHDDLHAFYDDMENPTTKEHVPDRACHCKARRPNSRNTDYDLTSDEADSLRCDPRVLSVERHPSLIGGSFGPMVTQYSQYFNKSSTDPSGNVFTSASNVWINWGLLRVYEGNARPNWGGNFNTMAGGNVVINTMGRNVDAVICDSGTIPYDHPEYAVNADGTGGSRVVQFNWYQYNAAVNGQTAGTFDYGPATIADHTTHCAGTVAGNTQGWARAANIYTCPYDAGGGPLGAGDYCFEYIKQFHINKPVNPATGIKNPTVVNNSWGWSIFPGQWSFADITQVTYRGTTYLPTGGTSGYSGICSATTEFANLGGNVILSGYQINTSNGNASVISTSSTLYGTAGLTYSNTPFSGSNDDGYWRLFPPFPVSFLGISYDTLYMGTNWYLTFGGGSTTYASISATNPPLPKICVSADDHNVLDLYYGTTGTVGSRIYIIHVEGNSNWSVGTSTNTVFEIWFYENDPARIDVKVGANGTYGTNTFSSQQLNSWGFIAGKRIPLRVASIDADVIDVINAGVVMVGAAGNGSWKHDVYGGIDWNNTFMMNNRYPGQVFYYMRGTSPTANDSSIGMVNICVGAVGYTMPETKAYFSDCGPGTDLYSPGFYISSSLVYTATDPRNRSYYQGKLSGTSMASPQICGVVASAMEVYPRWQQQDAKTWLLQNAAVNQLTAGNGGPTDTTDLQGGANLYLTYPTLVPTQGQVVPTPNYGTVPSTGQVYPRPRIFIYGS